MLHPLDVLELIFDSHITVLILVIMHQIVFLGFTFL